LALGFWQKQKQTKNLTADELPAAGCWLLANKPNPKAKARPKTLPLIALIDTDLRGLFGLYSLLYSLKIRYR